MQNILDSIDVALGNKNFYVALFVSLTLPDICVTLEHGKTTGGQYASWFDTHLTKYAGFLSGNDCYALRCALLHQGKDNITDQKKKEVLEHYVFLTKGAHCNLMKDCIINGVKTSFLQLNVERFCRDMHEATETWLKSVKSNNEVQKRLQETIIIREPGYVHMGVIRFS